MGEFGKKESRRPESIGNKLGFGSDGPRTQVCSNANSARRVAIKWCRSQRPYSFSDHKDVWPLQSRLFKFHYLLFIFFF